MHLVKYLMFKKHIFCLFRNREFIWEMSLRDLKTLNKGSFLGYFWLILSPLIQVSAYVFIVSFVFQKRMSDNSDTFQYAIYVLSGMIPWQVLTRSLQQSPVLIRQRMELIKQIIYPIETLPINNLIVSSIGLFSSFFVFLILSVYSHNITWTWILLPVPFSLLVLFIIGASWAFSIIGVIIKDLREIVTVILGLLVYISPVIASENLVGAKIWKIIQLNPLTHIVVCFRDVFYATFHVVSWVVFIILSVSSFFIGGLIISKTKTLINEYI